VIKLGIRHPRKKEKEKKKERKKFSFTAREEIPESSGFPNIGLKTKQHTPNFLGVWGAVELRSRYLSISMFLAPLDAVNL